MAETLSGLGDAGAAGAAAVSSAASETETRRLSDLRVIDLRAELKKRNLDSSGNKSVLMERLKKAIEDEGGNPDEIEVTAEGNKKMPKRPSKGKKPEDEGVEDNGLEENSGDGQEDVETSLENLQDMDMMDISVLDEADIDSGSVADCVEEEEEATLPEGLADSTELVEGDLKGLPEQLQEHAVDDKEAVNNVDTSSSDFTILQVLLCHTVPVSSSRAQFAVQDNGVGKPAKPSGPEVFSLDPQAPVRAGTLGNRAEGVTVPAHSGSLPSKGNGRGVPGASSVEEDSDTKRLSREEKGRSSCGRNFWVSGLSSTTRATDLKNLFSRYGKVVGAKVVTNARSPGARCYGFVTMSTAEEATKCISHLHKTELHGKMISVEKAKSEPAGKRVPDRRDGDSKKEKASTSDRSANLKREEKADRKDDAKKGDDGNTEKSKDLDDQKPGPSERSRTTKSGSRGTERTVVMDKSKERRDGEASRAAYLLLLSLMAALCCLPSLPPGSPLLGQLQTLASKSQDRKSASREKRSVVSFDKVKESRKSRDSESRRERERSEREQRLQAQWEREERERLEIARERLAFHRHRLERERMERERLERERMHVEQERRREQERIHREREELRRQQELRYEQERRPAVRRPYDVDGRRDDAYWPEAKRAALDDRYHSDFGRQDRFHDFDHRDRGRYPNHSVDRREGSRSMMGDREGQHYPERHGGPERHGRDSRDGWGYSSNKRMSEGRGLPPPPRGRRDWGEHSRRLEDDRAWQGAADGGMMEREHKRWQGGERSMSGHSGPGHMMNRGGMSGRGSFAPGGASRGHVIPRGGMQGGFGGQSRGSRPSDARFTRRY
ncbi:hypothetical protein NN561_000647 [Cricetulus griseus]